MRLINQTKNTILAEDVFIARTPFQRIKGLLGKKRFSSGQAIILEPCNSVHTFFMCFPIDVLFADKNNSVVKTVRQMRPFRVTGICLKSKFIIELPAGVIDASKTSVGDSITKQGQTPS